MLRSIDKAPSCPASRPWGVKQSLNHPKDSKSRTQHTVGIQEDEVASLSSMVPAEPPMPSSWNVGWVGLSWSWRGGRETEGFSWEVGASTLLGLFQSLSYSPP